MKSPKKDPRKDSIFWKKWFVPVYFIVGFSNYWLFKVYIGSINFSMYILIASCIGGGIASIIYNYKLSKSSKS